MSNRCPYCGTGDWCQCALDHPKGRRPNRKVATLAELLAAIPDAYAALPGFKLPGSQPPDPDKRTAASVVSHRSILRLEVVALLDEREKADAPPTRLFHPKFGGGAEHDRIAGQRRQGILPTLSAWVRDVDSAMWDEGDEHQNPPTQRTVAGECEWLTSQLDWIEAQPWVRELEDDLVRMLADIQLACGVKPAKPLECPACGWEMQGQGDYQAELKRYPWYRCTGCPQTITTAAELDRVSKRAEDYVALKYAAKVLEIPYATLRTWKARGLVRAVGRDARGDVFSLAALSAMARRMNTKSA